MIVLEERTSLDVLCRPAEAAIGLVTTTPELIWALVDLAPPSSFPDDHTVVIFGRAREERGVLDPVAGKGLGGSLGDEDRDDGAGDVTAAA